jgi:O-antigen ligase
LLARPIEGRHVGGADGSISGAPILRGAPVSPGASANRRPKRDPLMGLVALMVLTYVWRIQDILVPLALIKFPTLIGLAALAAYAFDKRRVRRLRLVRSPVLTILIGFAFVIVAGVPTSLLASSTLQFLLKDFLPNVFMAVLVAVCIRTRRDLDWLLGAHMIGAMLYGLYALLFFGVDATGRLDHMLYYDANDLALATVSTLPVAIYFLRDRSPRWQRRMAFCVAPVLLLNFIRSGSRGGFLSLITIAVCLMFGYRPIRTRRRIAAFSLCIGAIAAIGGSAFWDKMKTILAPDDDYNMQSETGRWQIWQNGLSIVKQRPFLGVGAQQFPEAEATLSDLGRERAESGGRQLPWQAAHNSYISVAAETGVFGFALFVSLLLTTIGTALLMIREARVNGSGELAALSRALAIAFAGYAVGAFFLTAEYKSILYLNIGCVLAVRKLLKLSQANASAARSVDPWALPGRTRWRQA